MWRLSQIDKQDITPTNYRTYASPELSTKPNWPSRWPNLRQVFTQCTVPLKSFVSQIETGMRQGLKLPDLSPECMHMCLDDANIFSDSHTSTSCTLVETCINSSTSTLLPKSGGSSHTIPDFLSVPRPLRETSRSASRSTSFLSSLRLDDDAATSPRRSSQPLMTALTFGGDQIARSSIVMMGSTLHPADTVMTTERTVSPSSMTAKLTPEGTSQPLASPTTTQDRSGHPRASKAPAAKPAHHSPWYVQCIAGAGAGAVAAVFVSPLDVVRMRMQVMKSSNPLDVFGFHIMKRMIKTEGPKSLYYGLGTNLIALIPNWLVYFLSYSEFRSACQPTLEPIIGRIPFDVIAAVFAGGITTLCTQPLWLVKARMQVQSASTLDEAVAAATTETVAAATAAPTASTAPVNASAVKPAYHEHFKPTGPSAHSFAKVGSHASVPEQVLESFEVQEVAKCKGQSAPPPQLQAAAQQSAIPVAEAAEGAAGIRYRNTFHALRVIFASEGFAGWYRGLTPQLFGLVHVGVQYPLYEALKRNVISYKENLIYPWAPDFLIDILSSKQHRPERGIATPTASTSTPKRGNGGSSGGLLNSWDIVFASTVSKLTACSFAYPHEVLRSRLQTQHHLVALGMVRPDEVYHSLWDAVKTIYQSEGIAGFYRGLPVSLLRSVPACVVTFLTYESILRYLDPKSAEVE